MSGTFRGSFYGSISFGDEYKSSKFTQGLMKSAGKKLKSKRRPEVQNN